MTHSNFHQIVRYLSVGAIVFSIDLATYTICLILSLPIPLAKGLGFIAAVISAFFMHRYWTFSVPHFSKLQGLKFGALYLSNLGINVVTNSFLIHLAGTSRLGLTLSFIGATSFCSIINFFGLKFFVFR